MFTLGSRGNNGYKNDLLNTGWGHFHLCGHTHTHTQSKYSPNTYHRFIYPLPYTGQNHFAEPNQHILTFLHPILMCRGQILSTAGDVSFELDLNATHPNNTNKVTCRDTKMGFWQILIGSSSLFLHSNSSFSKTLKHSRPNELSLHSGLPLITCTYDLNSSFTTTCSILSVPTNGWRILFAHLPCRSLGWGPGFLTLLF